MWDYLHGRGGWEIVERDDGYFDVSSGPECYLQPYERWPRHQQQAVALARGRVLDIGCGAGRVALFLQSKGLDATGVDISPLAIRTCRKQGLRKARVLPISGIDSRLGTFDTLVMFGNNFGLLGNPGRARRLLRRFHKLTSPHGRIIAESLDPHVRRGRHAHVPEHLDYQRRNVRRGHLPGELRFRIRYKRYCTPFFEYLIVSKHEMQQIVQGTGWRVTRFLDADSALYIAVLEKEPQS